MIWWYILKFEIYIFCDSKVVFLGIYVKDVIICVFKYNNKSNNGNYYLLNIYYRVSIIVSVLYMILII